MNDARGLRNERISSFRSGYLSLTLFLSGASVLVVEIVGARLVSPYFGASIFFWS